MTPETTKLVVALGWMYVQYCSLPNTHMFMGDGETAEELLENYGLISSDGSVDEVKLDNLEASI